MKAYLIIALLTYTTIAAAQENQNIDKGKELHVRITDFSPFSLGFDYKQQVKPKGYLTFSLVDLSFSLNKFTPTSTAADFPKENLILRGGIQFGYEFRRTFKKKFTFYHGPNVAFIYNYSKLTENNPSIEFKTQKSNSYTVSIPYNVGMMYQIHKNILITAQLSPFFSYTVTKQKVGDITQATQNAYNFGLANFAGTLAFAFRFND